MFKWPKLIWGFGSYSDAAKAKVSAREPWKSLSKLVYGRAIGSYSITEFRQFIAGKTSVEATVQAWLVAQMPGSIANVIAGLYCMLASRIGRGTAYDLARSPHSTWVSRMAARPKDAQIR